MSKPAEPDEPTPRAPAVLGTVTAELLHVSPDYHVQVRDRLTARVAELEAALEQQAELIKRALKLVSESLPMDSPELRLAGDVRRALGG